MNFRDSSRTNGSADQDELYKATRVLLKRFPDRVVDKVVRDSDPIQLLKDTCRAKGLVYYQVMSSTDADSEDDAPSQLPRHRAGSSPRSRKSSSESAFPSSSTSNSQPSPAFGEKILAWIGDDEKPLSAKQVPRAHCIIRRNVVYDRLQLKPKQLDRSVRVQYGSKYFQSDAMISFTWTWCGLGKGPTHDNNFYLVSDPLDIDVVVGELKPHDDLSYGSFGHDLQQDRHDDLDSANQHFESRHGSRLQPADLSTVTSTNSTPSSVTIRPLIPGASASRDGRVSEDSRARRAERRPSGSQIPRPSVPAPRSVISEPVEQTRFIPRPASEQAAVLSESPNSSVSEYVRVRLVYDDDECVMKIDLSCPGECFFEYFQEQVRKMMQREIHQDLHDVRFALRKDNQGKKFFVCLKIDEVEHGWSGAVDWINEIIALSGTRPPKIYAIIQNCNDS